MTAYVRFDSATTMNVISSYRKNVYMVHYEGHRSDQAINSGVKALTYKTIKFYQTVWSNRSNYEVKRKSYGASYLLQENPYCENGYETFCEYRPK